MAKKGQIFKKYSPEFKLSVILDMREHRLNYSETMRKYFPHLADSKNFQFLKAWERIYLEEGAAGFMVERRGRGSKGRPKKKPLPPEDLIDELQKLRERNEYLEMENEYLKKLDALIRAEEQKKKQ